jgi:membrane protein YdbS with pleckstrin-like domain
VVLKVETEQKKGVFPNVKIVNEGAEKITKKLAANEIYKKLVFIRNLCLGFIIGLLLVAVSNGTLKLAMLGVVMVAMIYVVFRNQQQMNYYQEKYGIIPNTLVKVQDGK